MRGLLLPALLTLLAAPSSVVAGPSSTGSSAESSAERRPSPLEEAALALTSPDAMTRFEAVNGLAALLAAAPDAAVAASAHANLETALLDPDPRVAIQAVALLERFGRGRPDLQTPRRVEIAHSVGTGAQAGHRRTDLEARRANRLGERRRERYDELVGLSNDDDPGLRLRAVQALGELAIAAPEALRGDVVTRLETAARDVDPLVAGQATATLLGLRGENPVPAEVRRRHRLLRERAEIDEHEEALADEDWTARLRAVQALADRALTALEPERVIDLLATTAVDGDPRVSAQASAALDRLGSRNTHGDDVRPEEH